MSQCLDHTWALLGIQALFWLGNHGCNTLCRCWIRHIRGYFDKIKRLSKWRDILVIPVSGRGSDGLAIWSHSLRRRCFRPRSIEHELLHIISNGTFRPIYFQLKTTCDSKHYWRFDNTSTLWIYKIRNILMTPLPIFAAEQGPDQKIRTAHCCYNSLRPYME